MEDERLSRKLRSENRLYNFLTRSRSRSRPKDEPPPPSSMSVSPNSKPVSRLPSRPLSSSTVTPKPRKQTTKPLPPDPPSTPSTPKPSGARQKLHDLFGIPLGRKSSRSRSRSRPPSPRSSFDIPPLPTDNDLTPKPRKSLISRPRSPSPTPGPKVLRVTNATTTSSSTGSTAASIKISKFFAKSNTPPSIPDPKRTPKTSATPHPAPPQIPSIVSAPLRSVSSLHRRSLKDPVIDLQPPSAPPKIVHTPPTPLKNPTTNGTQPTSARLGYHAAKASLDSSYRYRGATMSVLDEEAISQKSKSKEQHLLSSQPVPRPPGPIKMSNSARSTKHGSFDFERPGWGASIIQRTGSNGTSATGESRNETQSKERESVYGPGLAGVGTLQREESMKRSQEREEIQKTKERARKAAQTSVIADREKHSRSRPNASQQPTPHGSSTTPSEHVHGSTSTAGTGASAAAATGKSSSMSKATGRRHHGMKTASGSGISRFVGLTAHHGPFSFERPVPSPTWSTGTATSTGTAAYSEATTASWKGKKAEKERERVRDEMERQRESRRNGARKPGDRAPVPVPSVLPTMFKPSHGGSGSNAGHRSGTKGRSLDLGLGLAWAPSKVREDALLPSSAFFARSTSGGSSNGIGRSASGSTTTGRSGGSASGSTNTSHHPISRSASGNGRQEDRDMERSKLGKEVAEMFKNALDPEAFALFKRYAHQFDANQIPFDGPTGIVSLVEHLLVSAPHLGDEGKRCLLDKFVRIILQQA